MAWHGRPRFHERLGAVVWTIALVCLAAKAIAWLIGLVF